MATEASTSAISTFNAPLDYDATGGETLLAQSADGKSLLLQTITGGGGFGATVNSVISIPLTTAVTAPISALQPGGAPSIPAGGQDGLDDRFGGTTVQVNDELWAAQTVFDSKTGTDAIAWYEINLSGTPTITQQGLISDPNLYLLLSVAVSRFGGERRDRL